MIMLMIMLTQFETFGSKIGCMHVKCSFRIFINLQIEEKGVDHLPNGCNKLKIPETTGTSSFLCSHKKKCSHKKRTSDNAFGMCYFVLTFAIATKHPTDLRDVSDKMT